MTTKTEPTVDPADDLHWKLANPQVFADLLPYDEVSDAARPIDRLDKRALGPTSAQIVRGCAGWFRRSEM